MADPLSEWSSGGSGDGAGTADCRDDVVDDRDRQVLIVGDGVGAAAAAGFLDRLGLDPVLATPTRRRPLPPVVTVWESGLLLLERIGLRRPVERHGAALTRFACRTRGRCWPVGDPDRPVPVAVARSRLDSILECRLLDRIRTADRPVATLAPTERGVRATFERGVDELFDAVLTTERRLLPGDREMDARAIHRWTGRWPATAPTPDVPTEAWDGRRAALTVPTPDRLFVHLLTDAETTAVDAVGPDGVGDRFGHLFDPPVTPFSDRLVDVQYERLPCASPASRSVGGIALFGPASRASIPGDCLGTALAVEDAWVLADELASGSGVVPDRLARYERRRRRRDAELVAIGGADAADPRLPPAHSPPIRWLRATRAAVLGPASRSSLPAPAGDVPDRL
jgi:2-polyprenyl-6-methoxyphenol hydroxylase-like FAD-dependent oxidoreductase